MELRSVTAGECMPATKAKQQRTPEWVSYGSTSCYCREGRNEQQACMHKRACVYVCVCVCVCVNLYVNVYVCFVCLLVS